MIRDEVVKHDPGPSAHDAVIESAQALAASDFRSFLFGTFSPRPEIAHWPPRYREAYEAEWRRIEAERREELRRRDEASSGS